MISADDNGNNKQIYLSCIIMHTYIYIYMQTHELIDAWYADKHDSVSVSGSSTAF